MLVLRYCEKSSSVCVSLSVRRVVSQSVDTWVKSQGRLQIFLLLLSLSFLAPTSRSGSLFALFEVHRHVRAFGGGRNFEKYGLNLGFKQT